MSQYLVFQLHGPMASWGSDAPGEVRHTLDLPTRSALLGLLAAALGIKREEEQRLAQFNQHYQFILCASQHPRWARDYHTVQMPKETRKTRYFTRYDELRDVSLRETLISRRDYYTDAWWMVAVAMTEGASSTLEDLRDALQYPAFPLYLGRKSHPLALPLAPLILQGTAGEILPQAQQHYFQQLKTLRLRIVAPDRLQNTCWWEGEHEGLTAQKILQRRDQPVSREHWRFSSRDVFQGSLNKEESCICPK